MDATVLAAIIGAVALVLGVGVTVFGTVLVRRMDLMAKQNEAIEDRAARIDQAVQVIKVDVDGKLEQILQLNRDLQFAQGKEAGRLEEIATVHAVATEAAVQAAARAAADATAALIPELVVSMVPKVLPDIIGAVVEARVIDVRPTTED